MKTIGVVCLLLLSASVLSQSSVNVDCSDTNKFLVWLKTKNSDTVLATPNTSKPAAGWGACEQTWGTAGTCCDATKLKGAFKPMAEEIKKGWGKFMDSVKKFMDNSKKLKENAGGDRVKEKVDAAKSDSKIDLKGLNGDQAKAISAKMDNLGQQLKTFKDKADKCMKATVAVRTNIFCAGCQSGNGFSLTGSVLSYTFESGSCNAALEACIPVWSFMFDLQAQMLIAHEVKRKERGSGEAPKGVPKIPKGLDFGALATLFTNCATGKAEGSCTQANLDSICGSFISFKKPEPLATAPEDSDLNTAAGSRLLQNTENPDDGAGAAANGGIRLNRDSAALADVSVDASNTGSSNQNNSGNILMVGILSLVAAAISI